MYSKVPASTSTNPSWSRTTFLICIDFRRGPYSASDTRWAPVASKVLFADWGPARNSGMCINHCGVLPPCTRVQPQSRAVSACGCTSSVRAKKLLSVQQHEEGHLNSQRIYTRTSIIIFYVALYLQSVVSNTRPIPSRYILNPFLVVLVTTVPRIFT